MLPKELWITTRDQLNEILDYEKTIYNVNFTNYILQINESAILLRHLRLLRRCEYYTNSGKKIRNVFCRFFLRRMQNKYALRIPLNCCERGLKIMHLCPVMLNPNAVVGKDCVFHMNTALVAGGMNSDSPKLGNRVIVGIGAIVLGGVTIADDVAIGANAVVNKDISEVAIAVAGVPAKKISNNGSNSWNADKAKC